MVMWKIENLQIFDMLSILKYLLSGSEYMLNEEKIKLMTKTSIYEKKRNKDITIAEKYFKTDYITYSMIKTAVAVTIGYMVSLLIFVIWRAEELVKLISKADYFEVVKRIIIMYVIVLAIYMLISFAINTLKYDRAKRYLKVYSSRLKKIEKIDDEELSMTGRLGGTVNNDEYTGI